MIINKTLLLSRIVLPALLQWVLLGVPAHAQETLQQSIDEVAEQYVRFGLQLHNHDNNAYLYLGPEELRAKARAQPAALNDIRAGLLELYFSLRALPEPADDLLRQRKLALDQRIVAMIMRARILQGQFPADFDEETRLMFGVVVPKLDEQHFMSLAKELDALIPGEGELTQRMEKFRWTWLAPVANCCFRCSAAAR